MLSALGLWFSKQAAGLLLGFLSDFLVGLYKTYAANQAQRERGRAEATAEALAKQQQDQDEAAKARAEAEADHAKHPIDDGGFDPSFKRD